MQIGGSFFKNFILLVATFALLVLITILFPDFFHEIAKDPETYNLPYFIFRTMLRMSAAYVLTVAFGLSYGIIAGLYEKPRRVMIPLLDILQSIPVLGFLPAAILFFINLFPGELGVEIASIILIFTGQAWAVTFGVYGAVRSIPEDLRNASKAFGLRGFKYLRKLLLPFIFPSFVTGSILAWGGGWYFLVACEFMTFGGTIYTLPGVGYYLANAVYVQQNIPAALFGLGVFALLVLLINKLIWAPLLEYSDKFKVQLVGGEESSRAQPSFLVKLLELFFEKLDDLFEFLSEKQIFQKIPKVPPSMKIEVHKPEVVINPRRMALRQLIIFSIIFIITMYFFGLFVAASLKKPLDDLQLSFNTYPEAYSIPYFAFRSMLRIFFAYLIALTWTLAAGIAITRNKFLSQILLPIFDIGQSIPALALFPFIVMIVFKYLGTGSFGLEIASILLLLTGSQWYLLFNIIGAIKRIPKDISEAASSFGIKDWRFVRYVILPAIFPGIIVGSIQAWGGAWNATIVSEYINYGGHIQFEATYSGVELNNVTAFVGEKTSTISCSDGNCSGMLEVMGVGEHNASLVFHSPSGDFQLPIRFTVGDVGSAAENGNPVTIPASSGYITLITPTNGSSSPLNPYSVTGLGAFINKATAEWGDPWLITIAIAVMSLTVILLNHFVWGYLFMKAERYKFEMT